MIWLLYIPALWFLWRVLQWDMKRRTAFSFAIALFYACTLATVGPVYFVVQAFKSTPSCSCEMIKNHECAR